MSLYVPWLADAARSTGRPVVEVVNWRGRGHGGMTMVEGIVDHHTGTAAKASGEYPSLAVVTAGRSDLAGPLCNLGVGRTGTIYVVAGGCAWHAGASRWAGYADLNNKFLGIEIENPGDGRWPAVQLAAVNALNAALLRYMHRDASRIVTHRDAAIPAGRKVDPTGLTTKWLQDQAHALLTTPAKAAGSTGVAAAASSTTPTTTASTEDEDMRIVIPAGHNVRTIIALQPLVTHQITIAPGEKTVTVEHVYNWTNVEGKGSGGDLPGFTVHAREGETFTVPVGTQNCQLFTTSDDEFAIVVSAKPANAK